MQKSIFLPQKCPKYGSFLGVLSKIPAEILGDKFVHEIRTDHLPASNGGQGSAVRMVPVVRMAHVAGNSLAICICVFFSF